MPEACHLAAVFSALGCGPRVRILDMLAAGPMTVTAISKAIGMTQPSTSHHLAILLRARLVEYTRTGKFSLYHALPLATKLIAAARAQIGEGGEGQPTGRKKK
jgi:DNA-binding transcriptional ArsR family regulator